MTSLLLYLKIKTYLFKIYVVANSAIHKYNVLHLLAEASAINF